MTDVQASSEATIGLSTASHATERDALIIKLDELLEKYLKTLDAYQKAREQLSENLSSGYMNLAQANFQNRSSAVHYGQDCYDERMQAQRTVTIASAEDGSDSSNVSISVSKLHPEQSAPVESKDPKEAKLPEESQDGPTADEAEDSTEEEKKKVQRSTDPIRWFGILVPPALRSAQASFVSVVEGSVPQLISISHDLRSQEIEIGRVRKQLKKL